MGKRAKAGKAKAAMAATAASTFTPVASAALAPHHDAAGNGRRLRGWAPSSSGPNRANAGAPTLRNRARDAARNDWAGHAIPVRWAANLVGTGIIARPKTKDATLKDRLVELWDDWFEACDADGVLDGYGLQSLVARNWIESGEVFVRLRPRLPQDGLPVPLQLQVIESDMLPMYDGFAPNGNEIAQGIEFDRFGRRVAYWMHRNHPGDGRGHTGQLVRIDAQYILHIYEPSRPGQLRGVSDLAPILAKLRSVGNFDDAVLHRQELSNLFAGFVTRNTGAEAAIDPVTGLPVQFASDGAPMAALEPGLMQELLPGESVVFSEPPDSGANYAEFSRAQFQGIAAGAGLPYELLTGDVRDVSDRTLRVIIMEFRRHCQQRQWHILIPQLCRPIRAAWADAAVLCGALDAVDGREARRVEWVPHGFSYLHPVQDVQSKRLEVEAGFRSRSSVITERGDDPEFVDEQRAADQQRAIAAGLEYLPADPNAAKPADPQMLAAIDKAKAESTLLLAKGQRELDEGRASAERIQSAARRDEAEAQMLMARAAQHHAEAKATTARVDAEAAESAVRIAEAAAAQARASAESGARIAALEADAAAAREESARRIAAQADADAFAREQRELVISAERARAKVAALECEAAELGLAELRGS